MKTETRIKPSKVTEQHSVADGSRLADSKIWIVDNRCFLICILLIWVFFLWMISKTPYGLDDWLWGIPAGFDDFVSGNQNGRYVGNLFEIIVTRSVFLKVVLIGTMAMLLPFLSVCLVHKDIAKESFSKNKQEYLAVLFLLATLMYLNIPLEVWRQTFGWIAGFSNFGFSGVLLLLYLTQLFRANVIEQKCGLNGFVRCFLTSFCVSLILENITIYVLVVTAISTVIYTIRTKQYSSSHFSLLIGSIAGTVLMFSGSVYGSLLSTGHAYNDMRSITVDLSAGLWSNLRKLYSRYVYFFPRYLWGDQWIPCTLISCLLAAKSIRSKQKWRFFISIFFSLFAVYFVAVRFLGPIENHVDRWGDVLTQRLNLLFFWAGVVAILLFWRAERSRLSILLFLWLSVPGIILPLLATNTTSESSRCLLTPAVFLIVFCLTLIVDAEPVRNGYLRKGFNALIAVLLLVSVARLTIVSYENGLVMQEREALVKSAREGEAHYLDFPDFPYLDYLWVTEPLGDRQKGFFRAFYQIPEDVEINFNTGNEEDYDFFKAE